MRARGLVRYSLDPRRPWTGRERFISTEMENEGMLNKRREARRLKKSRVFFVHRKMKRKASPSKDITKSKKAPPTKKRKVFASPDLQKYALRARSSENKAVDTNFDLPFGNEDSLANKIVSINQCNKGTDRYQELDGKFVLQEFPSKLSMWMGHYL